MNNHSESKPTNNRTFPIIAGILGLLLIGAIIYAVNLNNQLNDYQNQAATLNTKVGDLNQIQTNLETELGELTSTYESTLDENATLNQTIEEKVKRINSLKAQIRKVKANLSASEQDNAAVRAELAKLEDLKSQLETSMLALQDANTNLQESETRLTGELMTTKGIVSELEDQLAELTTVNTKMENRLMTLAPAGFRADEFRIDIEKKNDKLTSKARQAKEINVQFNLDNVPSEKFGKHDIYLAVTDIYGKTITQIPSTMVSISTPNEPLKVEVADIQSVDLKQKQSIEMSFQPEERLSAGEYNLMVYSDAGYLGSTGFRLR